MQRRTFVKSLVGGALLWKPGALLAQQPMVATQPLDPQVKRVLVMFKCHFDAGFIDTQAAVVRRYFEVFFPNAIARASQMRASGNERYVWTTGSWLLYEYLEQASPAARARMEKAIAAGDIAWHALPFSWQTEMLDRSMIAGSIALSQALDKRFGRTTTGAKMTDVPGHTRGLIAPLAAQGVTFLDIGVNGASRPAQLPELFLWQAPRSEAALAVMYHAEYGSVVRVPGSDVAIAIVVRDDNSGPHTVEEIHATYSNLLARYPNAEVIPTNLTEIAHAVQPHRAQLPVVTQEIGDTWIHGVASDPLKVARYREVCRLRSAWVAGGRMAVGDATDVALLRHLLLEAEHTWGTDTKTWLDFDHYTPADLLPMLNTPHYKVVEFSWQEKRQDLFDGLAALPGPLRVQAETAVQALAAKEPSLAKARSHAVATDIETEHFILGIDANGAIRRLRNKTSGREWAAPDHTLGLFSYQTLSQKDYAQFFDRYVVSQADWAKKDFGKPNIEKFGAQSQSWLPALVDLQVAEDQQAHRLLALLEINDAPALQSGRAAYPQKMYMELIAPKAEPVLQLNFYWFGKPPTRLPEALWLSFRPLAADPKGWTLDKSGESISPFDVVVSGNRHMHAVDRGFGYQDARGQFFVETLDAPLVAIGDKSPLPFSNEQPDPTAGMHSNLFNNAWGTNYIMWFGEDMRFRFILHA
jgi:hypothetical protein